MRYRHCACCTSLVKDSQYLKDISNRLEKRLHNHGLLWHNCVADTGYSSGEDYAFLEQKGLLSYIPAHGTYKGGPEDFKYNKSEDHYVCKQGEIIPFKKVYYEGVNRNKKKEYRASKTVCVGCPLKSSCLKKSQEKRITITYYVEEYERNTIRIASPKGRYMKGSGRVR